MLDLSERLLSVSLFQGTELCRQMPAAVFRPLNQPREKKKSNKHESINTFAHYHMLQFSGRLKFHRIEHHGGRTGGSTAATQIPT